MQKIKLKFFCYITVIILFSILPHICSLAFNMHDDYIIIDGIEYYLTRFETDDGKVSCYATVGSTLVEDELNVSNGVLIMPSKVTYDGYEYAVTDISAQGAIPLSVSEVIIPEDFGTYYPENNYDYWCGIMDVKKMTILSDSIRISPYDAGDSRIETWTDDFGRLEEIEIQSNKVVVDENTFSNCHSLKKVTFHREAEVTLERGAFTKCEKLEKLVLPKNTEYKEGAIIQCENLKEISFYDKSSRYGFKNGALVTKTEPKTLLFLNSKDARYQLPKRIRAIGQFAFSSCTNLTEVKTTSSLRAVNRYAFYECTKLKKITLKEGLESVSSYAFQRCALSRVSVPRTVTHLGEGILWENQKLSSLSVEKGNPKYKSQNNMILTRSGKTLKMAAGERNVVIPRGVEKVDSDFVAKSRAVYTITYPETLKATGTLGNVNFAWGWRKPGPLMKNLEKAVFKGKNPPKVKDTLDYQKSTDHETRLYESLSVMEIPKGADKEKYKEFWHYYINTGKIVIK